MIEQIFWTNVIICIAFVIFMNIINLISRDPITRECLSDRWPEWSKVVIGLYIGISFLSAPIYAIWNVWSS